MKKVFIIIAILAFAVSGWVFYLNQVILPKEIKTMITEALEESTGKKVILGSVSFNIFKGLVLRDLIIYDGNVAIFNSAEVSAAVLVLPVFKKQIVIPAIKINSPEIFVERRADNSINILDPFFRKPPPRLKYDFALNIYKVSVRDGRVKFFDGAFNPEFTKELNDLDLDLVFSLPLKIRFNAAFEIPSEEPMVIRYSGEYNMHDKELTAKIGMKKFSFKEFAVYYKDALIPIPDGRVDAAIGLKYRDKVIGAELEALTEALVFHMDNITARIKSNTRITFRYGITDKRLNFVGKMDIADMEISGLPDVGIVEKIKASAAFSDASLSSDDISAYVLGLPVKAKINAADLHGPNPALKIELASDIALATLQKILNDDFRLKVPAEFEGRGRINLELRYKIPFKEMPDVNGSLDIFDATVYTETGKPPLEKVNGTFQFTSNQITWSAVDFRRLAADYKTSGTLTNFLTPGIQMKLSSKDLELASVFALKDKLVMISKCAGRYYDSAFSIDGVVDFTDPSKTMADIKGALNVDLEDLAKIFKDLKEKTAKVKPKGKVGAEFNLTGDIGDIKSCSIDARILSQSLSLYDLKLSGFAMSYSQKNAIADLAPIHSSLYGGTIDAVGRMELAAAGLPYTIEADIKGVRIEDLKADTAFKGNDIAGVVSAKARMSGAGGDISKLRGSGSLSINDGKLWQLNLFKGMGALLFSSDFSNIIFSDGRCNFLIKDRAVLTDDLQLKSDVIDMRGSVRIGFDNSIDLSLKAQISEEDIEAAPAVKNVTRAIGRYSVIKVTGTLKEPKYSVRPDVADIMEDLKNALFR